MDEVVEHHPEACRHCGTLLEGEDSDPLRHQMIEIPPITPLVIEHRLHRLICPCCSTSTCASLPADVEASHYGQRLSALVGLLGSAFPLSFSKSQVLLDQLLGVEISRGAMATIRERISATLERPMQEALDFARQQPVAYVDETAAAIGPWRGLWRSTARQEAGARGCPWHQAQQQDAQVQQRSGRLAGPQVQCPPSRPSELSGTRAHGQPPCADRRLQGDASHGGRHGWAGSSSKGSSTSGSAAREASASLRHSRLLKCNPLPRAPRPMA